MVTPAQSTSASQPLKQQALDLFAALPKRYDEMGWLLSFGQDRRWRRATVRGVRAAPSARILDVATGTGLVAAELVRRYGCSVLGIDQSDEMLDRARAARPEPPSPGASSSCAERPSTCRSPTRSSTVSRHRICFATWTIRPRRSASWPGSCEPAGDRLHGVRRSPVAPAARAVESLHAIRPPCRRACRVARMVRDRSLPVAAASREYYERYPLAVQRSSGRRRESARSRSAA